VKRKLASLLLLIILMSCSKEERRLQQIVDSGKIRVLTRNSALTYYENRDGEIEGFEYDAMMAFAQWLGVEVEFIVMDGHEEVMEAMKLEKADIAASGLSITPERKKKYLFSDGYLKVRQEILCHPEHKIKTPQDLIGKKIVVASSSSYEEDLKILKKEIPELQWSSEAEVEHYQLFESISKKKIDCTLVDNNIIAVYRRYFPELKDSITIGTPKWLGWMMARYNRGLQQKMNEWLNLESNKERFKVLNDKYYGHTKEFDPYDIKIFKARIKKRLIKYKDTLIKASKIIGWDWKLLAAIAYQESHWRPYAKSPTGVRGFMMLTRATAKQVGVKNRLDPDESIIGGAKYLKTIEERLPGYIQGEDRIWMTLASYNVGYAHVRDAWGVAAWFEKNPNRWNAVREVLPMLAKKKIYKRLPHGYARGLEPVVYVDRIRSYYDLLKRFYKKDESKS
jgi:membrane-bound lytic murein transglycosylase F